MAGELMPKAGQARLLVDVVTLAPPLVDAVRRARQTQPTALRPVPRCCHHAQPLAGAHAAWLALLKPSGQLGKGPSLTSEVRQEVDAF